MRRQLGRFLKYFENSANALTGYLFLHNVVKKVWKGVHNMSGGYGGGFALLVVLFILLIIIGAAYVGGGGYGY